MSESSSAEELPPAKKATKPSAKLKTAASHPPVAIMVNEAVTAMHDRKGSSLAAIKKYIAANYPNIDIVRLAPFIRRYIKASVLAGTLLQTTGTGAAGSFKMAKIEKPKAKVLKKLKAPKEPKSPKTAKKPRIAQKPAKLAKVTKEKIPTAKESKTSKTAKIPKTPKKVEKAAKPKRDAKPKAKKTKDAKPKVVKAKTPKATPAKSKTKKIKK